MRFRDEAKDIYLLKPPTVDRRLGGSNPIDEEGSLERDDPRIYASPSRARNSDFASMPPVDHESEVQSFLVLKLPTPYLSKNAKLDSPVPESAQNADGRSTKFSVAEGGFEAEGELDNNAASGVPNGPSSEPSPSDQAFTFHQSIEHQFTARILTFRVGREKPVVRVLVWRKSTTRSTGARGSGHICVDVYAFHPRTNEIVAGHCPTSSENWPAGACLIDLILPLKWWTPSLAKSEGEASGSGNGKNGYNR